MEDIMLPNEECLKEVLFEKSKDSLDQFISGFLHLADRINVSTETNNLILNFIKKFMPESNKIPKNFESVKKL